jgi:4-amino-4-deoxy-L-arabinose transferase-like glycosyltransferase
MRTLFFLIALLCFALLLRVSFIVAYDNSKFLAQEFFAGDSAAYDSAALNVMEGNGFLADGYRAKYGPIYPLFLAGAYRVFGHDIVVVRFLQALLGALSCVIVYFIGKDIFNEPTAWLASAGLALYYPAVQMPAYIMAEEVYVFVLLATIWCAVRLIRQPNFLLAAAAGMTYGVAVLCKGALSGFIPFFALVVYCSIDAASKRKIKYLAVFLLVLAATLTPWIYRNYSIFKKFIPVTIHSGDLLYKGNSPEATGGSGGFHTRGIDFIDAPAVPGLNEYERDQHLKQRAIAYMKNNPGRCVELALIKFWNMWRPYHTDTRSISKLVMCCTYVPIVFFALVGMCFSLRWWRRYLLFYLLFAYYIGVHMVLIGIIRYRYPMEPFLIIFAAYGLWCLYERLTGLPAFAGAKRA